jgi:hypothetical protein
MVWEISWYLFCDVMPCCDITETFRIFHGEWITDLFCALEMSLFSTAKMAQKMGCGDGDRHFFETIDSSKTLFETILW